MGEAYRQLCGSNKYPTTLHAINTALLKLGKIQKATKVYRGIARGGEREKEGVGGEGEGRGGESWGKAG